MGKKYVAGITDKRLKNRRFKKTEEAILEVFLKEDNYISLGKMADRVGIARSTIYRHHKAIREIVPDYQKYILRKFKILMRNNSGLCPKKMYERMLIFIIQNKKIFDVLLKSGETGVLKSMLMCLKPEIVGYTKLPKNYDKAFFVYMNEIVGLIEAWVMGGSEEDEMWVLLSDIDYLTDTLRVRLSGLVFDKS